MAYCSTNPRGNNEPRVNSAPIEPIFDSYKTAKYHKLIDYLISEAFMENAMDLGWTPNDLSNPKNLQKMTKIIYGKLHNLVVDWAKNPDSIYAGLSAQALEDIEDEEAGTGIIPQFEQFIKHYFKYSNIVKNENFELDDNFFEDDNSSTDATEDDVQLEANSEEEGADMDKAFDANANSESPAKLMDKEIKTLFRLIPKSRWNEDTGQVELFLDQDGLPTIADFGPVFNLLLDRLSNIKDLKQFKDTMQSTELLRVVPEAQYIYNLLKLDKSGVEMSISEFVLFQKFYQTFSKPKVQVQSAFRNKSGNFYLMDEISGNIKHIRAAFTGNFQMGAVDPDVAQYLTKDEMQGYSISVKKGLPPIDTRESRLKFLSLLGIEFSGLDFLTEERDEELFSTMLTETTDLLHESIWKRIKAGDIIRDPITQLRKSFNTPWDSTISSEANSIDKIVEFEGKYSRISPSLSSRNVEQELQYLITMDNQLSAVTYHLNNAKTLKELYKTSAFAGAQYNPLFENSYTIQYLFDKNGDKREGRTIDLTNLSGSKVETGDTTKAKLSRKLTPKDRMIQDFSMMMLEGKTETLRTETSHSFYSVGLLNNGVYNKMFSPRAFLSNFKSNNGFKRMVHGYLTAEIERVKSYPDKKRENPTLTDNYTRFSIFHQTLELGDPQLRKDVLSAGAKMEVTDPVFLRFMDAFEAEMQQEVEEFKTRMNVLGVTYDELMPKNLKNAKGNEDIDNDGYIRSFVANTMMQNIEFTIMFSSDPLFYVKGDFHKRLKGLSSTGDLASILPLFREFRDSAYEKGFKDNYSIAGAEGVEYANNDETFQTQTLTEHKQTKDFAYTQPEMVTSIQKSIMRRDGKLGEYTKELIEKSILAKAASQEPADGQGWISLDFHRELSLRFGFHTEELETAYKYEGLIYRKDILGEELTPEQERELTDLTVEIYKNPNRYGIPPLKMTYWGPLKNVTVDARGYDKFSTTPLLPSDVRNHPKMAKVLKDMTREKMGYVKYESAGKLFKTTPIDIDKLVGAGHDEYYTELLKLQIKPKITQKTTTAIPTQMLKLIFSGLFNQGKPTNAKVKELYDKYINTLKDIQKEQTKKLLKDLGITEDGIDMTQLSKRLVDQAKSQQMNSNVIEALTITDGNLKGVLEESGFVKQVIDLVAGISDKKLRRFELSGGDFILISNANRDPLKFYKYDEKGTIAAECRISLTNEYAKMLNLKHPDGLPIATIERMNVLLKNPSWVKKHQKALTIVLDRVPTQGINSMDFVIIAEFLPPTLGNVIILPDEIVYKSGTDFDYDKEKVMTPSFTDNGIYISDETQEDMNKELERLRADYAFFDKYVQDADEYDHDAARSFIDDQITNGLVGGAVESMQNTREEIEQALQLFYSIKNSSFQKHANQIIDTYRETLQLPESFADLVIPNGTRIVKPIAEENGAAINKPLNLPKFNRVFHYLENARVTATFFDAKTMLGPFAVDNTFMQLLQYMGININKEYTRYENKNGNGKRKIMNLLLTADELKKMSTESQYLTSLRDDAKAYVKQHFDSETINATVDAAKDPWFSLLNINYQNVGVVNFMKAQGVPFDRIVAYINQPVLMKYYEMIQNNVPKNKALEKMAEMLGMTYTSNTEIPSISKKQLAIMQNDPDIKIIETKPSKFKGKYIVTLDKTSKLDHFAVRKLLQGIDEGKKPTGAFAGLGNKLTYAPITEQMLRDGRTNENIEGNDFNMRVFAHFIMTEQHNQAFRNFQYYFNFDTTKIGGLAEIKDKENKRDLLYMQEMFSEEDLEAMENNSILSPFMNLDVLKKVFSEIFPVIGREDVQNSMNKLYSEYGKNFQTSNRKALRLMPKVLNSNFISAVVLNFNFDRKGQSFLRRNRHLIFRQKGRRTMADRLELLKAQEFFPELAQQFPVLKQLVVNKHMIQTDSDPNGLVKYTTIDNIQMLKPAQETAIEAESVIDQFKALGDYTFTNFTDAQGNEDTEKNERYSRLIREFMLDVYNTGILQSGYDETFIGFSEYIPRQYKAEVFSNALANLKRLSPAQMSNFLIRFENQFRYNNPKYFPKLKFDEMDPIKNMNDYSSRIKIYDINVKYRAENIDTSLVDEAEEERKEAAVVTPVTEEFTRKKVEIDNTSMYLFTDNAARTSGGTLLNPGSWYARKYGASSKYPSQTQAQVRGLTNAFPITTMVDDNKTQWTDDRFDEYKTIIDREIRDIKKMLPNYDALKYFSGKPFGDAGISKMRQTAPKIFEYLNKKLMEIGIANIPEAKKTAIPISAITRSNAKEEYSLPVGDGKFITRMGYQLKVKEYPGFIAYIGGSAKEGWTVDEISTGKSIPVKNLTIKDILPELVQTFNTWATKDANLETLRKVGLFTINPEDGTPPIEPKCK